MPNSTNVRKKDALSPALFVALKTWGPLDAPPQNTPIHVIASVQDTLVAGCAVAREPAPMGGVQEKAAQAPSQARSWACLHNSARSAATTATGRGCAHTAAELQRGGAPHPPTGVWPHASDAVAVDMQRSAGCSTVQRRLRHHAGRLQHRAVQAAIPATPRTSGARGRVHKGQQRHLARTRHRAACRDGAARTGQGCGGGCGRAAAAGHAHIARCVRGAAGTTYFGYTYYGYTYYGSTNSVRGAAGGTHEKPPLLVPVTAYITKV